MTFGDFAVEEHNPNKAADIQARMTSSTANSMVGFQWLD